MRANAAAFSWPLVFNRLLRELKASWLDSRAVLQARIYMSKKNASAMPCMRESCW